EEAFRVGTGQERERRVARFADQGLAAVGAEARPRRVLVAAVGAEHLWPSLKDWLRVREDEIFGGAGTPGSQASTMARYASASINASRSPGSIGRMRAIQPSPYGSALMRS